MKRIILSLSLLLFSAHTFALEAQSAIYAPLFKSDDALAENEMPSSADIHPKWLHQITAINSKAGIVTLEDGSEWKFGQWYNYWYTGSLKSWAVGDDVTISWYAGAMLLDTQIKNHTRNSYAWCELKAMPDPNNPNFTTIESMPNKMTLVLSNGARVTTRKPWMFTEASVGDVVVALYGNKMDGESLYALWDMTSLQISYDLRVN